MTIINEYFEQSQLSMAAYAEGLERGMFGAKDGIYIKKLVETANMGSIEICVGKLF